MAKCRPRRYAVITPKGITYGFSCSIHKIYTKRYATKELREIRLGEHRKSAKKSAKKS